MLSPRRWRDKSISLRCLPHSRIYSVCRTRFLKSAFDDIGRKRVLSRARLEDGGGRFFAGRGFSVSRPPPVFLAVFFFFLRTRYKLTPCLIPKPRPHSSRREIPCAACVVTSTHVAHYLRAAPRELISDINTQIRIVAARTPLVPSYRLQDHWSLIIRSTFNTHNEGDNPTDCENVRYNDRINWMHTKEFIGILPMIIFLIDSIFWIILFHRVRSYDLCERQATQCSIL